MEFCIEYLSGDSVPIYGWSLKCFLLLAVVMWKLQLKAISKHWYCVQISQRRPVTFFTLCRYIRHSCFMIDSFLEVWVEITLIKRNIYLTIAQLWLPFYVYILICTDCSCNFYLLLYDNRLASWNWTSAFNSEKLTNSQICKPMCYCMLRIWWVLLLKLKWCWRTGSNHKKDSWCYIMEAFDACSVISVRYNVN